MDRFAIVPEFFSFIVHGKRWWMVSIYWEGETAANPIPAEYLKKG